MKYTVEDLYNLNHNTGVPEAVVSRIPKRLTSGVPTRVPDLNSWTSKESVRNVRRILKCLNPRVTDRVWMSI